MPRDDAPGGPSRPSPRREQRDRELRIFGVNACLAAFAHRPESIRKAYLVEALVPRFRDALAVLARRRIGYRIVAPDDLEKLTQSQHHEGVCFEVLRPPPLALHEFLKRDHARGEHDRNDRDAASARRRYRMAPPIARLVDERAHERITASNRRACCSDQHEDQELDDHAQTTA